MRFWKRNKNSVDAAVSKQLDVAITLLRKRQKCAHAWDEQGHVFECTGCEYRVHIRSAIGKMIAASKSKE